ncbi:MAG: CBS domain-containing protein [Anaerolineales bacterium]
MKSVRHLLDVKGHEVWTIEPEATVYQALVVLAEKDIGALVVTQDENLVGIFSERDYTRKVALHGRVSKETRVSAVMTPDVITLGPDQPIDDCMSLMTEHRIRHLPVLEDGEIVGLISIGDVVKEVIEEQEFQINQLTNYISGER